MILLLVFLLALIVGTYIVMQQPRFGKAPAGNRLKRIQKSANYHNGRFNNLSKTPQFSDEANFGEILKGWYTTKRRRPKGVIPSVKNNLKSIPANANVLVWFGHSSYFMQIDGRKFLVDPVFCGHASPFSFSIKAFPGTDIYTVNDMPKIDYLVITHDHWDHLDYETVKALQPKIQKVITGLGVGEHLEYWGYEKEKIVEQDWHESVEPENGLSFFTMPARHFSGRRFKPKQTLWASFALITPSKKIFIGGDGGYDTHFAEIGKKIGGFDLAILENGQYNKAWKYIHLMPEQVLKAASDLKAKRLLPVHSGKFALAQHAWDEPLRKISLLNKDAGINLITPKIGELVYLNDNTQKFSQWWEEVE
ncbi:MAG: MBL fold metallo-hydrolase [Draconibacterium sp.]|nr:MAG: MBL fold metallo-hydrolase [Draconibacterium sp.]